MDADEPQGDAVQPVEGRAPADPPAALTETPMASSGAPPPAPPGGLAGPPLDVGPDPEAAADGRSSRWIVELVGVVLVALVVAFLLRTYVIATYSIPSGSMEPTLKVGDRIVVDKLSYHLHGVDEGNIIVFSTPKAEDCAGPPVANLVKRVIGLPGETISLSGGYVLINGRLLEESWLPASQRGRTYPGPSPAAYSLHHPFHIPQDEVYVMGDNRTLSCDSRYWGPIKESTIVGKVDLRIWPLSRLGFF